MEIIKELKNMLSDLLDIEDLHITPETYVVRELGAESIDLMELALVIESRFEIQADESEMFLTRLRELVMLAEDQGVEVVDHLTKRLPFLSRDRIKEIIEDLEYGPTLKIKDLISYIEWTRENG